MLTFIIVILILLPPFFSWRREIRLRKLAKSRYQLALSVTEMERSMLEGKIKLGEASHDILFKHMQRVQNSDVFEVNWNVLKTPDRKVLDLQKRLKSELSEDGCPFSHTIRNFTMSYFRAFRMKHPYKSFIYVLYLQLLHGGIKCLLTSLFCMISILRSIDMIKHKNKAIFEESSLSFFSHSEAVWLKAR